MFKLNVDEEALAYLKDYDQRQLYIDAKTDMKLKQDLVLSHYRLVASCVKNYHIPGYTEEDIAQEAFLALIHAVNMFDPDKGTQFSTYAVIAIRNAMVRCMAENAFGVYVPMHAASLAAKYRKERSRLIALGNPDPTDKEIAGNLGLPLGKVELASQVSGIKVHSLDIPPVEGDGTPEPYCLKDTKCNVEDEAIENIGQGYIRQWIEGAFPENRKNEKKNMVNRRKKRILYLRFGFVDGRPWTLQEIGKLFGVSREAVRQNESKALKQLKKKIPEEAKNSAT